MFDNAIRFRKWKLVFPYSLVFYIIPFNVIWDFLSIFYEGRAGSLSIVRGVILLFFVLIIFDKLPKNRITLSVLAFIAYIIMLFPLCSNLNYSINVSSKIFISLLMLPIGYRLIQTDSAIRMLSNNIFLIYMIVAIGFLSYNLLDVGGFTYADVGFDSGGLSDSWNLCTYSLLLAPLYLNYNKNKKKEIVFYVITFALMIILLISFKRIAITGLILGYLIFFYNYRKFKKVIKNLILVTIALVAMSPFYINPLLQKYEVRKEKFDISYIIEQESRALETVYIWEEIFKFENPVKSIFGTEAFNSVGMYAGGTFGERQAHIDYNLILISNGILGLLLYLNIYLQIYFKYKDIKINSLSHENRIYVAIFWSFFFTSLFTSLGGQMYEITFRSIIFLHIGAVLGFLTKKKWT